GGGGPKDSGVFTGPPTITSIIPQVLVGGGTVYIKGTDFGQMSDAAKIKVSVRSMAEQNEGGPGSGSDAGVSVIDLQIVNLTPTTITATLSANVVTVEGRVELVITTPGGTVTSTKPLSVISGTNGFGGATAPGSGLAGVVYQLQASTGQLPNFAAPCSD